MRSGDRPGLQNRRAASPMSPVCSTHTRFRHPSPAWLLKISSRNRSPASPLTTNHSRGTHSARAFTQYRIIFVDMSRQCGAPHTIWVISNRQSLPNLAAWLALVRQRTDKAPDFRLTFEALTNSLRQRGASFMAQSSLLPRSTDPNARWKQLYAVAVLELDDTKLRDRIAKARAAMRERADSLASLSGEERRTLNDGFRILLILEEMATKKNPAA